MKKQRVDFYNLTAVRCHGKPEGWRWYSLSSSDAPDGYVLLKGSVPVGTYRSGPRKGRTKWPPKQPSDAVWMTDSDVEETKRLWCVETGLCGKCCGSGREYVGWNKIEGDKRNPCTDCDATGKYFMRDRVAEGA